MKSPNSMSSDHIHHWVTVESSAVLVAKTTQPGSSNIKYNLSKETVMIKIAEKFNCFILIVYSTKETQSR